MSRNREVHRTWIHVDVKNAARFGGCRKPFVTSELGRRNSFPSFLISMESGSLVRGDAAIVIVSVKP